MPTTDELQQQINALTQRVDAITAPPTNYYTHRYSGEEIDNGVQGGLLLGIPSSKQQALRNIGGRPNRNLLDNWYFVGGGSQQGGGQFPINQRGQTSYTNAQTIMYTIDRWILGWNKTMTITESGLVLGSVAELFQQINPVDAAQIIGKLITITVLDSENHLYTVSAVYNGTDAITDPDTKVIFTPSHGGKPHSFWILANNVIAAKLELGPVQTLAYQDETGNWQLFETPDFQEEQAKCQAYALYGPLSGYPLVVANGHSYVRIPTPVPMRSLPVFSGKAEVFNQSTNESLGQHTLTVSEVFQNAVTCYIAGITVPCYVNIGPGSGLSADL